MKSCQCSHAILSLYVLISSATCFHLPPRLIISTEETKSRQDICPSINSFLTHRNTAWDSVLIDANVHNCSNTIFYVNLQTVYTSTKTSPSYNFLKLSFHFCHSFIHCITGWCSAIHELGYQAIGQIESNTVLDLCFYFEKALFSPKRQTHCAKYVECCIQHKLVSFSSQTDSDL